MENKLDHAKLIMNRFDFYIGAVNTRGAFLLAFNTFLFGGIVSNYEDILKLVAVGSEGVKYLNISLFILLTLSLLTTGLIMKSVYPFLSSGNSTKEPYHSLMFFKSVSEFSNAKEYKDKWKDLTDEEAEDDIIRQSYHLAKGLNKKYQALSLAIGVVYAQLIMLCITLVITSIY